MLKYLSIYISILFFAISAYAQEAKIPSPSGKAVSDYTNLLTDTQEDSIARKLERFYSTTSNQIAIVNIPIAWLGNKTMEEYSIELANYWQLGSKKNDNGVLFLIVGTPEDKEGRGLRFEVGYGLEAKLTDLMSKDIQTRFVVPHLKRGDFYKAIDTGIEAIMEVIRYEYQDDPKKVSVPFTGENESVQDPIALFTTSQKKQIEKALQKIWIIRPGKVKTVENDYSRDTVQLRSDYFNVEKNNSFWIQITPASISSPFLALENDTPKMQRNHYPAKIVILQRGLDIYGIDKLTHQKLMQLLQKQQFTEAILLSIQFIHQKSWNKMISVGWFFLYLFGINAVIYLQYWIGTRKGFSLKKRFFLEKVVFFFLTPVAIVTSFFLIFTGAIFITEELFTPFQPILFWLFWVLTMFLSLLIFYQYIFRKNPYAVEQFKWLNGTGGGSYTYSSSGSNYKSSSSSYKSSSSAYSSFSSSSSSSSSSYFGGGGSFGGGGASSSW